MLSPPSIRTVVPVTVAALGLARNATRSATSSGSVNRPMGICLRVTLSRPAKNSAPLAMSSAL